MSGFFLIKKQGIYWSNLLPGKKEKAIRRIFILIIVGISAILLTACSKESPQSTAIVTSGFTPIPKVSENTPKQSSESDAVETFSSDQLGFCFSYPKGYTQITDSETVEIVGPSLSGTDMKGLFWLEISAASDRTAEQIANQEMTSAAGLNLGRWTLTIDGEQAVVLDGIPGQDLQRRVYVVHQQTLYVLAFMPTRLENRAAGEQMEDLFAAVTNSWTWAPCATQK